MATFTWDQFASIKNLASHASEATTSAISLESVRTPQYSLKRIILLFSNMKCFLWNIKSENYLDEYRKLILKSVRLHPLLWKLIFWSLGRCFDKHKRTFSLIEKCRVTSLPCPQILGYSELRKGYITIKLYKVAEAHTSTRAKIVLTK